MIGELINTAAQMTNNCNEPRADGTKTGVRSAYTVFVDDNYHYQDERERYKLGVFEYCESALTACKKIVDEFLVQNYSVGMTAEDLYKIYTIFGEDPFLISDTPKSLFSAWNYAKERCAEICAG
ncbi:MAG TPA: hypothetical protein V6D48_18320 [Oculatellaceae cyanobacterium]